MCEYVTAVVDINERIFGHELSLVHSGASFRQQAKLCVTCRHIHSLCEYVTEVVGLNYGAFIHIHHMCKFVSVDGY